MTSQIFELSAMTSQTFQHSAITLNCTFGCDITFRYDITIEKEGERLGSFMGHTRQELQKMINLKLTFFHKNLVRNMNVITNVQ